MIPRVPPHLRRGPKPVPPEVELNPIYYLEEPEQGDTEEDRIAGFWRLHEPSPGGLFLGGVEVYGRNRRLICVTFSVGDAEMLLRMKRHNAALRRSFTERFND